MTLLTLGLSFVLNGHMTIEERVESTLQQMTLEERIAYIGGDRGFYVRPITRLGVAELKMSDGPLGIRNYGPAPAYPGGLASTFNPALAHKLGVALGQDARARGVDVWLGPGINLARIPECGRNWEYYGEDPYLAGVLAAQSIQGSESQGVAATVKHFVANNHESDRNNDSSEIDERTLREIYLKPFEYAIKDGKPHFLMNGYNLVNGVHCSENSFLLQQVLRDEWGFKGAVMSDWVSTYSTVGTVMNGLDLEMPDAKYMNAGLIKPLLESGKVTEAAINEKVRRLLTVNFELKQKQSEVAAKSLAEANKNAELSYEIASQSAVLLKNSGTLPLKKASIKRILVAGDPAKDTTGYHGGGSGYTGGVAPISLFSALGTVAGSNVQVTAASDATTRQKSSLPSSMKAEFFKGKNFEELVKEDIVKEIGGDWKARGPAQLSVTDSFSIRYTGKFQVPKDGNYILTSGSDDGMRVYIDNKLVVDEWVNRGFTQSRRKVTLKAGVQHDLKVEYYEDWGDARLLVQMVNEDEYLDSLIDSKQAQLSDVIVLGVGFGPNQESEGFDRPFELPFEQLAMIRGYAKFKKPMVVVLRSGGAVEIAPWLDSASALLQGWYPGERGNLAIAKILFGEINPSGRLSHTFPKTLKDTYYADAYPSKDRKLVYTEGMFMGYRWFDKNKVAPLFPFGFGLSYVRPTLASAVLNEDKVVVKLVNKSNVPAVEVVQVYASLKDTEVPQVVKKLVGFQRVEVAANATVSVSVPIERRELTFWNPATKKWTDGKNPDILVGTSSRDLPFKFTLNR